MGRDGLGVGAGGAVPRVGALCLERLLAVAYGVSARAPAAAARRGVCAAGPPSARRVLRVQVRRATAQSSRLPASAASARCCPPPVPRFPRCLSRIPRTGLPPAPRAARQRTRRPRRPRADCAPPACHHVRSVHCAVLMDPCSQGGRRHARPLLDEDGPAVLAAARGEQLGGSPGAWRLACPAAACFAVVAGHGQRGHDAQSPGACQPAVGGLDRH